MKYNVYVFLDDRNKPYYVGKTNDMKRRYKEHLHEIKIGNPLPKYNKARMLMKRGCKLKMKVVAGSNNEKKAFSLERHYIKEYRKKYVLYNLTHGGPDEVPLKINFPKKKRRVKKSMPIRKPLSPFKKKVKKKIKSKKIKKMGLTKRKK